MIINEIQLFSIILNNTLQLSSPSSDPAPSGSAASSASVVAAVVVAATAEAAVIADTAAVAVAVAYKQLVRVAVQISATAVAMLAHMDSAQVKVGQAAQLIQTSSLETCHWDSQQGRCHAGTLHSPLSSFELSVVISAVRAAW